MSKVVKEGWTKTLLINLVTAQRGTEPGYETYCGHNEGVRFLRIGDLSGKTDNPVFTKANGLLYISPDDILFALDGLPGLVAKGHSGAISSGIRLIKPKNQKVKKDFLFYALQSPKVQSIVKAYTTGSTILHAGRSLQFIEILVPPLPEQRKIATILSSVDETIEKTKAVIEQTKVVKIGLMQELLTRGLPGRHKKFKKTVIGEIPEEWNVVKLGDIAKVQTGIAKNKKVKPENWVILPYLRVANVQDGYVDLSEVKYIHIDENNVERYLLRKGDVLFNEGGDNDKLGRGCVWEAQVNPCLHQNHVFAVRCTSKTKISPYYLACYAASPRGKEYFLNASKQTTNLASINSTQLKLFPLPLPSINEQEAIISIIKSVGHCIFLNQEKLNSLISIKSAFMQVLLTGEVRVKT